jgi:hypothetical protein
MSIAGGGFFSRLVSKLRIRFEPSPRERQKLIDAKRAILACTQFELRRDAGQLHAFPSSIMTRVSDSDIPSLSGKGSNESEGDDAEKPPIEADYDFFLNKAIAHLEQKNADDYSIGELRQLLQNMLEPQVQSVLEQLRTTEMVLDSTNAYSSAAESSGGAMEGTRSGTRHLQRRMQQICQPLLMKEYVQLQQDLVAAIEPSKESESSDHEVEKWNPSFLFQMRKHDEMESIVNQLEFISNSDQEMEQNVDNFTSVDLEKMVQLAKGSILKNYLGYSLLSLPSTLPKAGNGLFLDGKAAAGSIIGFVPGQVWPREYLLDDSVLVNNFSKDENYELAARHDGVLIDSRNVPHTVPPVPGTNILSLGHVANHPPPGGDYNVCVAPFNFYDPNLQEGLKCYIPNTYAKKPQLLGSRVMNMDIIMHSNVLLATKDLSNEEVFINYRLNPSHKHPSWYTPCAPDEANRTWSKQ